MVHRRSALLASTLLAVPLVTALPTTGASAETAVGGAQGEAFSLASTLGRVQDDGTAQGGKSLMIWSNGAATGTVRATGPTAALLVRARGDQCGGAPTMRVTVDGTVRASTAVSSATWTTIRVPVSANAGDRRVAVSFTNDYRTSQCDRNLHLDAVTFTASPEATPTAGTAVGGAQGEAFSLASRLGRVQDDGTAQGGKALKIWSNGAATGTVRVTAPTAALLVRARGDQCGGAPTMRVTVDGTVRASTAVSSATWTTIRVPVSANAGDRRVAVSFTNDYRTSQCDRNLHLDAVTFTASPVATPIVPPPGDTGPTPAPSSGNLVFDADVANKGLAAYASTHNANRISITDDPVLGDRRKVMRFTVHDSDDQLTGNPRAQTETAKFWQAGQEQYVGMSFYFPLDFPLQQDTKQWVNLGEVYGAPYAGASPNGLFVKRVSSGGQVIAWQRNGQYAWDRPFEVPLVKGRWHDFVFRIKLSSDPKVGFWEAWSNTGSGWQRLKLKGLDRLYTQTIDASNNGGPNYHKLAHYRSKGMWPVATHYAAGHKIGSSFDAVAPRSYS